MIYNFIDFRNLEYVCVEVYFYEIIDYVDDEEGYDIVLNLDFVIFCEVYRNNLSKYFVNDKTSSFIEVIKLLKLKDVDLNNNCFFIL